MLSQDCFEFLGLLGKSIGGFQIAVVKGQRVVCKIDEGDLGPFQELRRCEKKSLVDRVFPGASGEGENLDRLVHAPFSMGTILGKTESLG